jgi:hypothetical protein
LRFVATAILFVRAVPVWWQAGTAFRFIMSHHKHSSGSSHAVAGKRPAVFGKVFRWKSEAPGAAQPVKVEVTGSFTGWKPVALKYVPASGDWQLALHDIPGNRTHNYMLLVDGQPAPDKNADGLAVPHSAEEQQHQLMTARGPRVFMLFSQTK